MIQRIQTVWLLLSSAAIFATLRFSFYSGIDRKGVSDQFLIGTSAFLLLLTTIILGSLIFVNIFLFKKRVLQFRLCITAILIELGLIFLYFREVQTYAKGTYSLAAIFHIIVLLFLFLAARGIRKDEKLIKESNRLR